MLVLAIDTSTPDLVVGLVDSENSTTLAEQILAETRRHNELLTPTVQEVLAAAGKSFAELSAVVVGCGPGPFTGLRVGMATAAAFGDALGIPVHGVCSLDAIARQLSADTALVATDARRREVYWASYRAGVRTAGPAVQTPATVEPPHEVEVVSVPEALAAELVLLSEVDKRDLGPTAASLVTLADLTATPEPLEPLYLRRPDAKEPKEKPRSPAIPEVQL